MFAINHAATGLIIKKIFPGVPMPMILGSVQLIELLWVALNFAGVERTTTEDRVQSVSDLHLAHMPYSHSVASTLALGAGAWVVAAVGFKAVDVGTALALGIFSHIVLDLVSHARDIAVAPIRESPKLGVGLYEKPGVAFAFETVYGVFCWWVYGGGAVLLWIIVLFNLANSSFFIKAIPGPEKLLAGKPKWIAGVVLIQIVVTAVLVGVFS
jgi:hypothetical protein